MLFPTKRIIFSDVLCLLWVPRIPHCLVKKQSFCCMLIESLVNQMQKKTGGACVHCVEEDLTGAVCHTGVRKHNPCPNLPHSAQLLMVQKS